MLIFVVPDSQANRTSTFSGSRMASSTSSSRCVGSSRRGQHLLVRRPGRSQLLLRSESRAANRRECHLASIPRRQILNSGPVPQCTFIQAPGAVHQSKESRLECEERRISGDRADDPAQETLAIRLHLQPHPVRFSALQVLLVVDLGAVADLLSALFRREVALSFREQLEPASSVQRRCNM